MISLRTIMLTLIALTGIFTAYAVSANDFPRDKVQYICNTAVFYYTTTLDDCMMEQYAWYQDVIGMGLTNKQYNNALWYGQHKNWRGEVVAVDFKLVLDRVEYLEKVK